jgi:hypothetical protein
MSFNLIPMVQDAQWVYNPSRLNQRVQCPYGFKSAQAIPSNILESTLHHRVFKCKEGLYFYQASYMLGVSYFL